MPLAFFCTLFFRHRKKSVSAPYGCKPFPRAGVGASAPAGEICLRQSYRLSLQAGGFPRGKQSARFALPCAPLVVCLNSGSLTACGGCIHWIPASLRSPLHPFGSPKEMCERPLERQVPIRAGIGVSDPAGAGICTCGCTMALSLFPHRKSPACIQPHTGLYPISLRLPA